MNTSFRSFQYAGLVKDAAVLKWSKTDSARRQQQQKIASRMSRMRGMPQKLGQMLSFGSGNEESAFEELQEHGAPLSLEQIRQAIDDAGCLPCGFKLDPEPKSASIGQVHRAVLKGGQEVAIKVQYPGIHDAIVSDLKHLNVLAFPFGNLKKGFNYQAYCEMFKDQFELECDYLQEAEAQGVFHENWPESSGVVIPRPYLQHCHRNILVSQWEPGEHHRRVAATWPMKQKLELAEILMKFFLQGLFCHGQIQADWHPGNLRFRRVEGVVQLVVYDLGCVFRCDDAQRSALAGLIEATRRGDTSVFEHFLAVGFDEQLLHPLESKLPALCQILFEPFCRAGKFKLSDWQLSRRVSELMGDDRWNLRFAGPPKLLYLMRAFHGLIYYLKSWGTHFNWAKSYDKNCFASLKRSPVPMQRLQTAIQRLKIRITDNGETKFQITQPATMLEKLDEVLGMELKEKIESRGVDILQVAKDAKASGYTPGEVFHVQYGSRNVRAWIE